jgi:hypothetical protein
VAGGKIIPALEQQKTSRIEAFFAGDVLAPGAGSTTARVRLVPGIA